MSVHKDLYTPIGRRGAIHQLDRDAEVAGSADDTCVLPVGAVVVAPGVGGTVAEESLGAVTPDVVQPDTLVAGGCKVPTRTLVPRHLAIRSGWWVYINVHQLLFWLARHFSIVDKKGHDNG